MLRGIERLDGRQDFLYTNAADRSFCWVQYGLTDLYRQSRFVNNGD
jgi:hypothetical protein